MQREARMYLTDIQSAARKIQEYTGGRQFSDYEAGEMLRDAVERKFEIIGIALAELAARDEALAHRISDYRKIIAFRNVLAHGYAHVDNATVWDTVVNNLPLLARQVDALLEGT
ncbi:MAG: DUF86 domain-containing protein [Chloroflexi bacterium]|nr:DUF86 domain-containing protein [Chloroflexota bacterium]